MAAIEGGQLVRLLDDLVELLGGDRDPSDTAIDRLTPSAYPDDEEAARTYRSATADDLIARRRTDAVTVRTAIASSLPSAEAASDEDAFAQIDVMATSADLDAWMRTLTALRLVIADRLAIESDDEHDPDDPRYGVYDWLGYRLEVVVQAADRLD
ncbi:DUF2017 family protein [Microbacterium sp. CR_7]|uniref:DUF2017 family protein n=1 Tax=Microbacterium sp. CR_7 TaxID=3055792 RepID=UPI0035BF5022